MSVQVIFEKLHPEILQYMLTTFRQQCNDGVHVTVNTELMVFSSLRYVTAERQQRNEATK